MSSYRAEAIHPVTGKIEMADFIDDYFGRHRYGIIFDDGRVFKDDGTVKIPKKRKFSDGPPKTLESDYKRS